MAAAPMTQITKRLYWADPGMRFQRPGLYVWIGPVRGTRLHRLFSWCHISRPGRMLRLRYLWKWVGNRRIIAAETVQALTESLGTSAST